MTHDDETLKLMFKVITEKLSDDIIGCLDGLHIMHGVLHGAVDKLGGLILEMQTSQSLEAEKAFWEIVAFIRTIVSQQKKTSEELHDLLGAKLAEGTDTLLLKQQEAEFISKLKDIGTYVVVPNNKLIH